jgi:hypothetical protein
MERCKEWPGTFRNRNEYDVTWLDSGTITESKIDEDISVSLEYESGRGHKKIIYRFQILLAMLCYFRN